jgi:hypothetical protein
MAASVDTVEAEAVTATTTIAVAIETNLPLAPIPTAIARDHGIDIAPNLNVGQAEKTPSTKKIYPTNYAKNSTTLECSTGTTTSAESWIA